MSRRVSNSSGQPSAELPASGAARAAGWRCGSLVRTELRQEPLSLRWRYGNVIRLRLMCGEFGFDLRHRHEARVSDPVYLVSEPAQLVLQCADSLAPKANYRLGKRFICQRDKEIQHLENDEGPVLLQSIGQSCDDFEFRALNVDLDDGDAFQLEFCRDLVPASQTDILIAPVEVVGAERFNHARCRIKFRLAGEKLDDLGLVREANWQDGVVYQVIIMDELLHHRAASYLRLETQIFPRAVDRKHLEHRLADVGANVDENSIATGKRSAQNAIEPRLALLHSHGEPQRIQRVATASIGAAADGDGAASRKT